MKYVCLICFMSCVFLCCAFGIDTKQTMEFDGETYTLAFSNKLPSGVLTDKYLRAGESVRQWEKMITIQYNPALADPVKAAVDLGAVLESQYPQAEYSIRRFEEKSEAMLYFLVWSGKDQPVAEFNIYRYLKYGNAPGLMVYQFSFTRLGLSMQDFKNIVEVHKQKWVDLMTEAEFALVAK